MITIRLLGGAKNALGGRSSIHYEKQKATVSEILNFLQVTSSDKRILNPANLIVAINGVDAAALDGQSTEARSGDVVTIVTVVHGGSVTFSGGIRGAIVGVKKIDDGDIGGFLERVRRINEDVSIQAVSSEAVFGADHVLRIIAIVIETSKRGIMIANKPETEFILRLACTNQISEAIARAGVTNDCPACIVAFSDNDAKLERFIQTVKSLLEVDETVIEPTPQKKIQLAKRAGVEPTCASAELINHLVEKAAILVR